MQPGPLSGLRRRAQRQLESLPRRPDGVAVRPRGLTDDGQPGRPAPGQQLPRGGRLRPGERPRRLRRPEPAPVREWFLSRWAAGLLGELLRRAGDRPDSARLSGAAVVAVLGALLLGVAGSADTYLHRGVETANAAPFVQHPVPPGLATNARLMALEEDARLATIADLRELGFTYVRFPISWAEIEPEPGRFDWAPLDATLTALEEAGITPVVVVQGAPGWARGEGQERAVDAPPADPTDFGGFVDALARQFSGRLPFLQVWDWPNQPDHWGGRTPDPVLYTTMLGVATNAVRQASPQTRVVLAELAPDPLGGIPDVDYLRAVYRSGGAAFFDVVAAIADGGARSPFDRQVEEDRINLSRVVLYREVMLEEGDETTPVWATHFGWASGPGGVGPAEQAEFTVAGMERARIEWPWMGLMFAWAYDEEISGIAGRALVSEGRPTPTLEAVTGRREALTGAAGTGYVPTNAIEGGAVVFDGNWVEQDTGVGFRTTVSEGSKVTITFEGSGLIANVRLSPDAGIVRVTLDGGPANQLVPDPESDGQASLLDLRYSPALISSQVLATGLPETTHTMTLELVEGGQFSLGGFVVARDVPTLWPIVLLAATGAVLLFIATREVLLVFAWRSGRLRRRRDIELNRPDAW